MYLILCVFSYNIKHLISSKIQKSIAFTSQGLNALDETADSDMLLKGLVQHLGEHHFIIIYLNVKNS